jgi:hypothetical protein
MRSNVNIRSTVIKVDSRPPVEEKPFTEIEVVIDDGNEPATGSILVCFNGAHAETAAKLEPGDVINVDGALRERKWDTLRDGMRSKIVVDGKRFVRIPRRKQIVKSVA